MAVDLKGLALCKIIIRGFSLLCSSVQLKGRFLSSSQAQAPRCPSTPCNSHPKPELGTVEAAMKPSHHTPPSPPPALIC